MQQIEQGILFEDGYLGVTLGALIFSQGVVLIDAPIRPEDARAWRSATLTQRSASTRLLVSLDAHPDRTLGARALECTIIAHLKAAQVFRNRPSIFKGQSSETGSAWETFSDAVGMRWASPDITFTERMSLHLGGPEVNLEHRPGPTPGSLWVIIPAAQVIFVGDSLTVNQPPFLAQADLPVWIENLETLAKFYVNYRIVSGRGGLASVEDIRKLRKLLKDMSNKMEQLANKNAAPEATQELIPWLLSHYSYPPQMQELYTARLRYGLYHCFAKRYRPTSVSGQTEIEEEEQ